MKKFTVVFASLAIAGCLCGMNADVAPPASAWTEANAQIWNVEHNAAVAKDDDSMGVAAVLAARDLFRDKDPQAEIDYFTTTLYDTKVRAVQREIHLVLADLYKAQGQSDKALDQLQKLMLDQ